MNPLVFVFKGLGGIVAALGLSGTFMAVVALVLLGLALRFVERADRVLERLQKRWRRLPIWEKQIVGFLTVVLVGPLVWRAVPKTAGAVAVVLAVGTYWWGVGLKHARRYGLVGVSPWQAWCHHWQVSRDARKLTRATAAGTGKPGGKARMPTVTDIGVETVVEPPNQMSATAFADAINNGDLQSATAREMGWPEVKDMTAEPVGDGTVRVRVHRDVDKDDFFEQSHQWPGMEQL